MTRRRSREEFKRRRWVEQVGRSIGTDRCSADRWSAVSQAASLQGVICFWAFERPADRRSAIQQTSGLRYFLFVFLVNNINRQSRREQQRRSVGAGAVQVGERNHVIVRGRQQFLERAGPFLTHRADLAAALVQE